MWRRAPPYLAPRSTAPPLTSRALWSRSRRPQQLSRKASDVSPALSQPTRLRPKEPRPTQREPIRLPPKELTRQRREPKKLMPQRYELHRKPPVPRLQLWQPARMTNPRSRRSLKPSLPTKRQRLALRRHRASLSEPAKWPPRSHSPHLKPPKPPRPRCQARPLQPKQKPVLPQPPAAAPGPLRAPTAAGRKNLKVTSKKQYSKQEQSPIQALQPHPTRQ